MWHSLCFDFLDGSEFLVYKFCLCTTTGAKLIENIVSNKRNAILEQSCAIFGSFQDLEKIIFNFCFLIICATDVLFLPKDAECDVEFKNDNYFDHFLGIKKLFVSLISP